MPFPMPGIIARGTMLENLDNHINGFLKQGYYDEVLKAFEGVGTNLADHLDKVAEEHGGLTKAEAKWIREEWLSGDGPWPKPEVPKPEVRASIMAQGYREAIEIAKPGGKTIRTYHVCIGEHFEVYLLEMETEVALLLTTPQNPSHQGQGVSPLTHADGIRIIAKQSRIDQICSESEPKKPEPSSDPVATAAALDRYNQQVAAVHDALRPKDHDGAYSAEVLTKPPPASQSMA